MNLIDRLRTALAARYTIEREIGAGGMATVFLAEDVRHRRKVAIKVLREDLAATVGAARFLREIEIAAGLQHPHILPLLDSGDADGLLFYVMPFVEGQSLRQRLTRERELPIADAVRIIVEVVDALAYAHAHGVIHRDIKPDNVMLTTRHAVVTDFGVAKAFSDASADAGGAVTSLGVALGTPAYMSPEQAAADPQVDHRSDIYSIGILAYELVAGRPPFSGNSPQRLLAAHVTETPDPVSRHRPGVPPQLEAAIMRCLEKRAADRWQRTDELLAILEPMATPSGGTAPTSARLPSVTAPAQPRRRWAMIAVPMGLALAAIAVWSATRTKTAPLVIGRSQQLTNEPELEIQPAISPDGKFVAYAAGSSHHMRIFIRPVGGGRTIPLSDDTTALQYQPQWSPDGLRLLFLVGSGASIAPALGGETRAAVPGSTAGPVTAATWSPDGQEIAFVRADSLYRVPSNGGTARYIGSAVALHSCAWSPGGKWIACASLNFESVVPGSAFGNRAPSGIVLFPVAGGSPSALVEAKESNLSPVWSTDGSTLYFLSSRDGPRDVYALAINSSGLGAGTPQRLTTGLNAISISVSGDAKRLTYAIYSTRANIWSVPIPTGSATGMESATPVTTGNQTIETMSVSPDGKWVLYDSDLRGNSDIFRIPLAGGAPEQLTTEPWDEFDGALSPDGRHVAYHSFRNGSRDIEVKPLDGGEVERVTASPAQESDPRWSRDGTSLSYYDRAAPFHIGVTRRTAAGRWSPAINLGPGVGSEWLPDGQAILALNLTVNAATGVRLRNERPVIFSVSLRGGTKRTVFASPATGPVIDRRFAVSRDGSTLYLKSHDSQGRTSFWALPLPGGAMRLLVRLTDPARQSSSPAFATDDKRLYFAINERQSDVFVAELTPRRD